MTIEIVETNANGYNDISSVTGWLKEPYENEIGIECKLHRWSCFTYDYDVRKEREFIESIVSRWPDLYEKFEIRWHSNI